MDWLTRTTGTEAAESSFVKKRPAMSGMPSVSKYPGVTARECAMKNPRAGGATTTPPFYAGTEGAQFTVEGIAPPARGFFIAHSRAVTPGYFETLGIPLIAGRFFTNDDSAASVPVVLVSQSMVERYFPGGNAIGRRVKRG